MADLDYPLVFECGDCEAAATITRADAGGSDHDPESVLSVTGALEQRGWTYGPHGRKLLCPDCAGAEG